MVSLSLAVFLSSLPVIVLELGYFLLALPAMVGLMKLLVLGKSGLGV